MADPASAPLPGSQQTAARCSPWRRRRLRAARGLKPCSGASPVAAMAPIHGPVLRPAATGRCTAQPPAGEAQISVPSFHGSRKRNPRDSLRSAFRPAYDSGQPDHQPIMDPPRPAAAERRVVQRSRTPPPYDSDLESRQSDIYRARFPGHAAFQHPGPQEYRLDRQRFASSPRDRRADTANRIP
jgi:hypothetical protein